MGGSEGGMTARERLDNILRSHLIDPDLLRADDFEGFYQDRKEKLLQLIEAKTGKDILRDAESDDGDEVDEPLIEAAE